MANIKNKIIFMLEERKAVETEIFLAILKWKEKNDKIREYINKLDKQELSEEAIKIIDDWLCSTAETEEFLRNNIDWDSFIERKFHEALTLKK